MLRLLRSSFFGLEKAGGPQPPAAEARSHLFAALRRLQPAGVKQAFYACVMPRRGEPRGRGKMDCALCIMN